MAPTVAGDDVFRAWWDLMAAVPDRQYGRAVSKVIAEADVRVSWDTSKPTLILPCRIDVHPSGTWSLPRRAHRWSRLVRLPGTDTLYWVGDTGPMLDEGEEFITGVRRR